MKRIIGILIGCFYGVLSGSAFTSSVGNQSMGNADLGLWWAVVGTLLGIAGLGALFGTLIHARSAGD